MEYYSDMRKEDTIQFITTQMNLEGIMLSKKQHTEKDKNCMLSFIHGIYF